MIAVFLRHVRAHARPLALLATVVLAIALLSGGASRSLEHARTANVQSELDDVQPARRDLSAVEIGTPVPGTARGTRLHGDVATAWGRLDAALQNTYDAMPPRVSSVLERPSFAVNLVVGPATPLDPDTVAPDVRLVTGFDPRLAEHVHVTRGRLPRPIAEPQPGGGTVDIVLSEATADRMHWRVGTTWRVSIGNAPAVRTRLSGTYRPIDPTDPIWRHEQPTLKPSVIERDGLVPIVTGIGWADPGSYPQLLGLAATSEVRTWFPLRTHQVTAGTATAVADSLRDAGRTGITVPGPSEPMEDSSGVPRVQPLTTLGLDSGTPPAIQASERSGSATTAVVALMASGPVGAALAVLALAVAVVTRRERPRLVLLRSRGATGTQVRCLRAAEALLVSVPAAAVGAVLADLLVRGGGAQSWWWPALAALVPAGMIAVAALPPTAARREDLVRRPRMAVAEIVIGVAVVAAVVLIRRRGLDTSGEAGVDPLVLSAPLLFVLTGAMIARRAQPLVSRWALAVAARRPGADAVVGAARGLRNPSVGLAAMLALVTGVAITVFSASTTATIDAGVEEEAHRQVGADVRIDARPGADLTRSDIAAWKDVDAVAGVARDSGLDVTTHGRPVTADVIVADVAALRRVQRGLANHVRLPDALQHDDALTVLASDDIARHLHGGVEIGGTPVKVVTSTGTPGPALTSAESWVIVDRAGARNAGVDATKARRFLVASAHADRVDAAASEQSLVTATTRTAVVDDLRARSTHAAVRGGAILSLGIVSVLFLVALVLTLSAGEASRARHAGLLRALGHRERITRLAVWEIGPSLAVAVLVGSIVGFVMSATLMDRLDLAAFTGSAHDPAWRMPVVVVPLAALCAVAIGLVAVAITTRIHRRPAIIETLRMMED